LTWAVPKADQLIKACSSGKQPREALLKWAACFKCRNGSQLQHSNFSSALASLPTFRYSHNVNLSGQSVAKRRKLAEKDGKSVKDYALKQCIVDHGVVLTPPFVADWLYQALVDAFQILTPLLGEGNPVK